MPTNIELINFSSHALYQLLTHCIEAMAEAMAVTNTIAAVEAQIAQLNAQFKEVIEILQLTPDSRPPFTESTLKCFSEALTRTTEDFDSYRRRWTESTTTINERESRLEQERKNIKEKEKLLSVQTTEILERDQRSEGKAAELKKREERLEERESDITRREKLLTERESDITRKEKLLTERTSAVDERDRDLNKLAENVRIELQSVSDRKETIVAAEARQLADEQALERGHEFLRQKYDNIIALSETVNEVRIAARNEHNKAVDQLNKDMQKAHGIFESAREFRTTLIEMYQKAKSMVEDVDTTKTSVVRQYETMLRRIQDEKQNVSRLQLHATLLSETLSSDRRGVVSLSEKVQRLSRNLEKFGNELNEQDARFDKALRKIGQVTDASGGIDDLTSKLEAFEVAASKQKSRLELGVSGLHFDLHRATHDVGSSPEKGPPAKRQRHSRRAVSVGPTEMLTGSLKCPEPLPANILDPFISSPRREMPQQDRPEKIQGLGFSDSDPQLTQTVQTSLASNVQPSSPGTLMPSRQAVGSTSASSATEPRGLADASDNVKGIWSRLELPRDWQVQDSETMLETFVKHEGKDYHWTPDGCLNRGAKWNNEGHRKICLLREFSKKKAEFADGVERRCEECKRKGGPCINVLWANEAEEEEGGKRWLLAKRK